MSELTKRFKNAYNNPLFSNLTLSIQIEKFEDHITGKRKRSEDLEKIDVNSLILCSQSDYFNTMITSTFKESRAQNTTICISVPDSFLKKLIKRCQRMK